MNNSTATQQNNQPKQDAWGLAYEAKRVSSIVSESVYALRSINDVLLFNSINKENDNNTLSEYTVKGLLAAINLIGNTLDDGANDLIGTLVKGGFNHE